MNPLAAMSEAEQLVFILRVLSAADRGEVHSSLWWRTDVPYAPVEFSVTCSDEFYNASADAEDLTPDNINVFEQAITDTLEATKGGVFRNRGCAAYAPMLFCARVRKMRPLPGAYPDGPDHAKVRDMLDACGSERA